MNQTRLQILGRLSPTIPVVAVYHKQKFCLLTIPDFGNGSMRSGMAQGPGVSESQEANSFSIDTRPFHPYNMSLAVGR